MILIFNIYPDTRLLRYILVCSFLISCGDDNVTPVVEPEIPNSHSVVQDEFQGEKLVIYNNRLFDIIVAYNRELDGELLEFEESDSLPAILKDNVGNYWDVFGESISGPDKGARLNWIGQVKAYWFSIGAFYPEATLFSESIERERLEIIEKDGWLIDTDFVVQAALPNVIPAINGPQFKEIKTKELFIEGNHNQEDLILAVKIGNEARIYPERVLEYHEIVNDVFQNTNVTISFCPLTGTGYCWDRGGFTFYVSGLLHNANLILSDWESDSRWSQIYGKSVFGASKDRTLEEIPIIEMNWEGRALVNSNKSLDTGQELPVGSPYGSYKSSNSIGYPVSFLDTRLPPKDKVLAVIINGKAKVYTAHDF